MSHPANDRINDYLSDQVDEALSIIYKACASSKKLLTEYAGWDQLDYHAKEIALKETAWIRKAAKLRIPLEEAREMQSATQMEVL